MVKYRLVKYWNDDLADYQYSLEQFYPKEAKHSCYSCYDDWRWCRKSCERNQDRWEASTGGNLAWAKANAEHYKIEVPKEENDGS